MSWIRIDSEVMRSAEMIRIQHMTRKPAEQVLGCMTLVWLHLDECGYMVGEKVSDKSKAFKNCDAILPDADIDLLCLMAGEHCRSMIQAMFDVCWIIVEGKDLRFPNFGRRAVKGLRRDREDWGRGMAKARWTDDCDNANGHAVRNASDNALGNATRNASSNALGNANSHAKTERTDRQHKQKEGGDTAVADPASIPPAQVVGYWNSVLGQKTRTTEKRKQAIRARSRDDHWQANWQEAIRKVSQSGFCMGQNDRGWIAGLDWFLRPDTVTKLIEGEYDDRQGTAGKPAGKSQQRTDNQFNAIEAFLADDDEGGVLGTGGNVIAIEAARGSEPGADAGVVRSTEPILIEDRSASSAHDDVPF